ncbi:MAG: efflux RND transporter periplasmic adaptor subunit [Roseburia sp.]|nr:efflux RND transporter periplasmic adaptor subunit [Roseburia sp.]
MKGNVKSKKTKVILIVVAVILVVVIAISFVVSRLKTAVESVANTVKVETVEKRDLSDSISLTGTAAGASKTNITSKAQAEVTAVNVQVGDQVTAGDVLCTFDSAAIQENLSITEKTLTNESAVTKNTAKQNEKALSDAKSDQQDQLNAANTKITQAQEDYDSANTKLANDRNTLAAKQADLSAAEAAMNQANSDAAAAPDDATKAKAAENAATTYESLKTEVSALQSQVDTESASLTDLSRAVDSAKSDYDSVKKSTDKAIASAQNVVDMQGYQDTDSATQKTQKDLQNQLDDCQIVAPCDGVVTAVNVSVGDTNTPGTTIITIEDTSSMKINATVNESDILKIQEGMTAVVKTNATGNEEIPGTVSRVVRVKNQSTTPTTGSTASAATSTSGGYAAEVTVGPSDLLVGMSAKVKVIIEERKNVLAVPYDLIQTDENGKNYVMLADYQEDGSAVAKRCNVEVGKEVNYYTEITGGDLKEGDALIYDTSIQEGATFSPSQMYSNGTTTVENETTEEEQ